MNEGFSNGFKKQSVKKSVKKVKDASILKEAHLEWLLQIINDSNIKGKDLQLVYTVQWLQQEYKRLQDEVTTEWRYHLLKIVFEYNK